MRRMAIPRPLLVFGMVCLIAGLGLLSYIVVDYRTVNGPWRELLLLEKENAQQQEQLRAMTEEILLVAQELMGMPEYDGEGEIAQRLLVAYGDMERPLASPRPVQAGYRSLVREMHASLDCLDRELDSLAQLYDPKSLYALGGSPADEGIGDDLLMSPEAANRALMERRLRKIARERGVTPRLALSMAKVESRFDPKAVSPKGAIGVLQVMPHVALGEYDVSPEELFDPDVNIRVGLTLMKGLLKRFDQNVELSLAAYNAGPTRVVDAGYQIPPIRQTQEYVKRVKQAMDDYGSPSWYD